MSWLEIQSRELKYFLNFQATMEDIHAQTYGLLLDTFIKDAEQRQHLLSDIQSLPSITRKNKLHRHTYSLGSTTRPDPSEPVGTRLTASVFGFSTWTDLLSLGCSVCLWCQHLERSLNPPQLR